MVHARPPTRRSATVSLHLAVALRGAGWHPAAWATPAAEPGRLIDAAYWAGLAIEAERARLDFVTLDDSLGPRPGRWAGGNDRIRGRLGAVLLAARIAPLTRGIGLMPGVATRSSEPYHLAQALATLDHVSGGRAGWRVEVDGRTGAPSRGWARGRLGGPFEEAAEVVEAARRLWEGAGGFAGRWVKVSGVPTSPRPPQGRPVVAVQAGTPCGYRFAARSADIVWVTPRDKDDAHAIVAQVRRAEAIEGRVEPPLHIYADLAVFSDPVRKAQLDELHGEVYAPAVVTGCPERLADLVLDWRDAGIDGFRLRPGIMPADLTAVTRGLVPELRRRGAFRDDYDEATDLRGRLELGRPSWVG